MDNLFFKRLDDKHWLGLRLPAGMDITTAEGNRLDVVPQHELGNTPAPLWPAGAVLHGPGATMDAGGLVLAWLDRDAARPFNDAYADVLDDLQRLDAGTGTHQEMIDKIKHARQLSAVSLPLRCYQAYIGIQGVLGVARTTDDWRRVCLEALSPRPGQLPIEAFGGLLFLVRSEGEPRRTAPEMPLYVDPVQPGDKLLGLQIKAFQHSAGIAFELSDGAGKGVFTNGGIQEFFNEGTSDATFSGYYRVTRTLGVVERPSRRSGLVVIPRELHEPAGDAAVAAAGTSPGVPWVHRPFRPADRLMPDELIGELLNYRIELVNPHGSVVRAGRVMLQRLRLDPPAAMTRAMARLVRDGESTRLIIRFDLPPTERADGDRLSAVLYKIETPALPTGFYADADDAAIQVARLLSDIDPMAVSDVRTTDQLPPGASSRTSQLNLSNHGLTPYPSQEGVALADLTARDPTPDGHGADDPWHGCRWEWNIEPTDIVRAGQAVRLLLALRRRVPPDAAGFAYDGAIPESPVLELQMAIGFDPDTTEGDLSVVHFEQFWTGATDEPLPLLDVDHVFFSEAPDDGQAGRHAKVRLQLQHLAPAAAAAAEPVGGYRIWLRDIPAPHVEHIAFEPIAVVQAVPQLVKAYAPIEVGRQWLIEETAAKDDLASDVDIAQDSFLAPPGGMIRREDEKGSIEDVVARLNEEIERDNLSGADARAHARSAALLFEAWRLLRADDCREVVLTVAQRRALVRTGAKAWTAKEGTPGNWILFRDQNGGFLGRAWTFRGVNAVRLRRFYVLREIPNTQDTVAIDDFGQITWTWAGLQDGWHHELEWAVEPLSRYAPLRRRAQTLSTRAAQHAAPPQSDPPPAWLGQPRPIVDPGIHRHGVKRRESFAGRRVGLLQASASTQDAFVWKASLPAEFRRATHNTLARTALGVLRVELLSVQAEPLLNKEYQLDRLKQVLPVWCRDSVGSADPTVPAQDALQEGHEIVVHQPAAFKVRLAVRPRADDLAGDETVIEALRQPKAFSNRKAMLDARDHCRMTADQRVLVLPLARLDWSYTGPARPTVNDILGAAPGDNVPAGQKAGMRLPDPHAAATVFVVEDGVLRPCAYFYGPAIPQTDAPMPAGWKPSDSDVVFGRAFVDGQTCTKVEFDSGGSHPGHLQINLSDEVVADRFRVLWRREGASSGLLTPRNA
ncbi:hypothetical protein [Pseudorhodoferax sp.]|uniref:hypothetical protein n=1 Tax=Pseudorhodoferax sp. TaxID=1993553 RepID=UPI002DD66AFE|nr:hypothetical protein [Pseudorhodoferax sp.]